MEGKKVGRPFGSKFSLSAHMIRITFEDETDKKEVLEYIRSKAKGVCQGRVVRDIIKSQMEKDKWTSKQ